MFAHNNTEIDYFRLAVVNSFLIQKNLGIKDITVVTDTATYEYAIGILGEDIINSAINNIIITEKDVDFKATNVRLYKDTRNTPMQLSFYNLNRCDAYRLSPYDETILLDVDYLIFSDMLNQCWGHNNDLMMNWHFTDVMPERNYEKIHSRVNPLGITQYWATVVYFRKTPYAESFFNIARHVQNNNLYYKMLYRLPGSLYRNDFTFSIAAHMCGGFVDKALPQLPVTLYKTFDTDDVHSVPNMNEIVLYLEKFQAPSDFIMTRWKDLDIHIMNKWAINRISDDLLEFCGVS